MSIVINSKTYTFDGFDRNGVAVYTERSGGIPTSFSVLTFGIESSKEYQRITVRLSVPIVAADDSSCSCAGSALRTSRMTWVFEEPNTGVAAERTDWAARVTQLAANAQFVALLTNFVKPTA